MDQTQEVPVFRGAGQPPPGPGAGDPARSGQRTTVLGSGTPARPARPTHDDVRSGTTPRAALSAGTSAPSEAGRQQPRGTRRRARLTVRRIDPWSMFTTALVFSVFLGIVLLVAVLVLYGLLDSAGVLESISDALATFGVIDEGSEVVSRGQVLLATTVLAAVDVVLVTVLATLFAFLYNLVASLTGGIKVTLSEGD